jgi:hypothetical protein
MHQLIKPMIVTTVELTVELIIATVIHKIYNQHQITTHSIPTDVPPITNPTHASTAVIETPTYVLPEAPPILEPYPDQYNAPELADPATVVQARQILTQMATSAFTPPYESNTFVTAIQRSFAPVASPADIVMLQFAHARCDGDTAAYVDSSHWWGNEAQPAVAVSDGNVRASTSVGNTRVSLQIDIFGIIQFTKAVFNYLTRPSKKQIRQKTEAERKASTSNNIRIDARNGVHRSTSEEERILLFYESLAHDLVNDAELGIYAQEILRFLKDKNAAEILVQAFPDMEQKGREQCIQNAKKSTIIIENMVNNIGIILMSREHKKLSKAQLAKQAAKNVVSSGQNSCNNNNDDKDKDKNKKRKQNTLSQTEAAKKIKGRYESTGETGKYRLRDGQEPLRDADGKPIERLEWDWKHGDWEAYTTTQGRVGSHKCSLDPETLQPYKAGISDRSART